MKLKFCLNQLSKYFGTFILLLITTGLVYPLPAQAYVSGGAGKLSLSPASATFQTGQSSTVDILYSNNVVISGIAVRLTFSVPSSLDLKVESVQPNTALSGWSFPVSSTLTSSGTTTIDLMALNSTTTGAAISTNTKLATITFKALAPFTAKAVQFDTTQTKMLKKVDASDILGTVTNGLYNASGSVVPTETPVPADTATPAPTSTSAPAATATSKPLPTATKKPYRPPTAKPTPSPLPSPTFEVQPTTPPEPTGLLELTVYPFTNDKQEAPTTFVVSGLTAANANVTISIAPDGVYGSVTADAGGSWEYNVASLTQGQKQLLVTATDALNGEQKNFTQNFTVTGGSKGFPWYLILGLLLVVGFVVFLFLRRRSGEPLPPPPPAPPTPESPEPSVPLAENLPPAPPPPAA